MLSIFQITPKSSKSVSISVKNSKHAQKIHALEFEVACTVPCLPCSRRPGGTGPAAALRAA